MRRTQQQTTWTDDLTPNGKKDVSRERWQRLNTPQPPHKDSFPSSIPPVCGSEDSQNLDETPGECGEETLNYSCCYCHSQISTCVLDPIPPCQLKDFVPTNLSFFSINFPLSILFWGRSSFWRLQPHLSIILFLFPNSSKYFSILPDSASLLPSLSFSFTPPPFCLYHIPIRVFLLPNQQNHSCQSPNTSILPKLLAAFNTVDHFFLEALSLLDFWDSNLSCFFVLLPMFLV